MLSTLDAARWGATRQIPDSKLLPRFIYDVLTQISNDFQRSLCRVQWRQTLAVAAWRDTTTVASGVDTVKAFFCSADVFLFCFYPPSLSFCHRSAWLMSIMCTDERSLLQIMSRHAPYCWLATSLFWYRADSVFQNGFEKIHTPPLNKITFVN